MKNLYDFKNFCLFENNNSGDTSGSTQKYIMGKVNESVGEITFMDNEKDIKMIEKVYKNIQPISSLIFGAKLILVKKKLNGSQFELNLYSVNNRNIFHKDLLKWLIDNKLCDVEIKDDGKWIGYENIILLTKDKDDMISIASTYETEGYKDYFGDNVELLPLYQQENPDFNHSVSVFMSQAQREKHTKKLNYVSDFASFR